MQLETINIPATNRFASLYIAQEEEVNQHFHYKLSDSNVFQKRIQDLSERSFKREALADVIETYMSKFSLTEETKQSIEKLKKPNSVVVIGGQQAGLLTGPLYSIHKIISILVLSKQQEMTTGVPIVPVFWIAGEDHDVLEVNHVFADNGEKIAKLSYAEGPLEKKMVSHMTFNKDLMKNWVKKVIRSFGETKETKQLLLTFHSVIEKATTYVDFFSFLITDLFNAYGLLLIDSADKGLRELEKPFLKNLVEHFDDITERVLRQQSVLDQAKFQKTIDISSQALNLFYYTGKERVLLEYHSEEKLFVDKHKTVQFTKEALLQLIEEKPELISNNVVTRPMMQEWLFPTLAFIAGPGEIAYWGELKQAFEYVGFAMPPIMPRLNLTLVEPTNVSDAKDLQVEIDQVIKNGLSEQKENFVRSIQDTEVNQIFAETLDMLQEQYQKLEAKGSKGMLPLIDKNKQFHQKQISFLHSKWQLSEEEKHRTVLRKYDKLTRTLRPNGSVQERIWNVYYYINKYGHSVIDELLSLNYTFDGKHNVVYL